MLTSYIPKGVLPFPPEILAMINRYVFLSFKREVGQKLGMVKVRTFVRNDNRVFNTSFFQITVKILANFVLVFAIAKVDEDQTQTFLGVRAFKYKRPKFHDDLDESIQRYHDIPAIPNESVPLYDYIPRPFCAKKGLELVDDFCRYFAISIIVYECLGLCYIKTAETFYLFFHPKSRKY